MGANWALFTAISTNGKGHSQHSDYLFENIRFEEQASTPPITVVVNWAAERSGKMYNAVKRKVPVLSVR